jgi:hypothetical protein
MPSLLSVNLVDGQCRANPAADDSTHNALTLDLILGLPMGNLSLPPGIEPVNADDDRPGRQVVPESDDVHPPAHLTHLLQSNLLVGDGSSHARISPDPPV